MYKKPNTNNTNFQPQVFLPPPCVNLEPSFEKYTRKNIVSNEKPISEFNTIKETSSLRGSNHELSVIAYDNSIYNTDVTNKILSFDSLTVNRKKSPTSKISCYETNSGIRTNDNICYHNNSTCNLSSLCMASNLYTSPSSLDLNYDETKNTLSKIQSNKFTSCSFDDIPEPRETSFTDDNLSHRTFKVSHNRRNLLPNRLPDKIYLHKNNQEKKILFILKITFVLTIFMTVLITVFSINYIMLLRKLNSQNRDTNLNLYQHQNTIFNEPLIVQKCKGYKSFNLCIKKLFSKNDQCQKFKNEIIKEKIKSNLTDIKNRSLSELLQEINFYKIILSSVPTNTLVTENYNIKDSLDYEINQKDIINKICLNKASTPIHPMIFK